MTSNNSDKIVATYLLLLLLSRLTILLGCATSDKLKTMGLLLKSYNQYLVQRSFYRRFVLTKPSLLQTFGAEFYSKNELTYENTYANSY